MFLTIINFLFAIITVDMFTVVFHRHFSCRQIRDTAELTKVKCVSGVHSLEATSVAIWQPVYNNNSKKRKEKKGKKKPT